VVTFLGPRTNRETLLRFVRRVRPAGPGWKGFHGAEEGPSDDLPRALLAWSLGTLGVYALLLATGSLLLGHAVRGVILIVIAIASGAALARVWFSKGVRAEQP
jgi:hypothetical protein